MPDVAPAPDDAHLFGETAVERGFVTREQLEAALEQQRAQGGRKRLGEVLVELGLITQPQATAIEKLNELKQRQNLRRRGDDEDLTGKTLGGCMLLERIGTGGMGTTYRAHHLRLDRDVALKVLHPRLVAIDGNLERFAREARAAANLEHPSIVSVYDFDQDGGYHFIVMQYVRGQNLRQVLSARGALGMRRGLWLGARVLEGLAHAHSRGIVHRDIKPANLLLTPEPRVKIADFGLVRLLSMPTSEKISVFGEIIGSPAYMAPEQASGEDVDARADLYSLGITIFELIAGRPAFTGASTLEVLEKQIMEPLPDILQITDDATPELQRFLARMTAKAPADRFASAEQALASLQTLRTADHGTTRSLGNVSRTAADPSRTEEEVPAMVSEQALAELKKRLSLSRELVAFEADDEGGDEQPPPAPAAAPPLDRQALVEASFSQLEVCSSTLSAAQRAIEEAAARGEAERDVPEVLHRLLKEGHVDELLALEKVIDRVLPTSAATSFFIARAYEQKDRLEEARARLAMAVVFSPDHLPARLRLARVLVGMGRTDEAVDALQQALVWHPDSAQAAVRLAEVLYVVKGDRAGAVTAYERAIELAPTRWQLRQQLAWILYELGRFDQAEAVLREVVAWNKEAAPAHELLRQIQRKKSAARKRTATRPAGEREETEVENPGPSTSARLDAIRLASASHKWERALKVALEGLQEKPRSVPLLVAAARAQVELGRLAEAVKTYGVALSLDPRNQEALEGLQAAQRARRQPRSREAD